MKKGEIKHGFTIIEVVLVLAVAGLIFVMIFIALPALQRSQRDNSRRDDMMNFISQVKRYQTNNRGALPGLKDSVPVANVTYQATTTDSATWKGFYHDYLGERFIDPDGEQYKLTVMRCDGAGTENASCGKGYKDYLEKLPTTAFGTAPNDYRIMVVLQAKCNGIEAVGSSNPRNLAVLYKLEGSEAYCFGT